MFKSVLFQKEVPSHGIGTQGAGDEKSMKKILKAVTGDIKGHRTPIMGPPPEGRRPEVLTEVVRTMYQIKQ